MFTELEVFFQIPRGPVAVPFAEEFKERFMLQTALLHPLKKTVVAVEFVNGAKKNIVMPPQGP